MLPWPCGQSRKFRHFRIIHSHPGLGRNQWETLLVQPRRNAASADLMKKGSTTCAFIRPTKETKNEGNQVDKARYYSDPYKYRLYSHVYCYL